MDLHAATDRFPVEVQRIVLEQLVGSKEYADAWKRVMIQKPFANPWGEPIHYGCGQPIGAYSSWAIFALCHHLVVRTAAQRAGLLPAGFTQYALLGDDIVLTNPLVAEQYQQLMDELGVALSPSKTHVSVDTYEFAKRWFQAGTEISGIPIRAFLDLERWYEVAEELSSSVSRWSTSPLDMESGSIPSLLSVLGLRIRDADKVRAFLHIPRRGDTKDIRSRKVFHLTSRFFSQVLGCFSRPEFEEQFVLQSLAEVKAALMESGIRNIFKLANEFLQGLAREYAGELPDQGALLALPVVAGVRQQAMNLQNSFDQLRSAYYDLDEDIVFNNVAIAMSDPSRVMTKRASKVVMIARANLVNLYKNWSLDYVSTRDHLLNDISCPPPETQDPPSPQEMAHPGNQTRW